MTTNPPNTPSPAVAVMPPATAGDDARPDELAAKRSGLDVRLAAVEAELVELRPLAAMLPLVPYLAAALTHPKLSKMLSKLTPDA